MKITKLIHSSLFKYNLVEKTIRSNTQFIHIHAQGREANLILNFFQIPNKTTT